MTKEIPCPGTTSYGITGNDDLPVWHHAHKADEPCRWITTPNAVYNKLLVGDVLGVEVTGSSVRWFINNVEVTPIMNGYAGIPAKQPLLRIKFV